MRFIFLLFTFTFCQSLLAFDSNGHNAIEMQAYFLLKNSPNGEQVLDFLRKRGILYDDLICHSSFPDFSLARQFQQNKQMYHFMASNSAVLNACNEQTKALRQKKLLMAAFPDCYESMYLFYRESILNGIGAKQSGRGVYVLMHIIADSYSSEHATRDILTEEISAIKGWQLSRLCWPHEAKDILPDNTLLLLHRKSHTEGDKSWKDISQPNGMSIIGMQAATTIKDLLILIYNAMQANADLDLLYNKFIQDHFKPFNGQIAGDYFTFPSSKDTLQFNFRSKFINPNDRKDEIYKFDRYPCNSWTLIYQTGTKSSVSGAYGIEYARYISALQADNPSSIITQIPISLGIVLTELNQYAQKTSFIKAIKANAFFSASLSAPIIPFSIEPRLGIAALPFNSKTSLSVPWGAELVTNIFGNFGFPDNYTKRIRIVFGFQHDNQELPAKNNFYFKLGFNTWQARFVKEK